MQSRVRKSKAKGFRRTAKRYGALREVQSHLKAARRILTRKSMKGLNIDRKSLAETIVTIRGISASMPYNHESMQEYLENPRAFRLK